MFTRGRKGSSPSHMLLEVTFKHWRLFPQSKHFWRRSCPSFLLVFQFDLIKLENKEYNLFVTNYNWRESMTTFIKQIPPYKAAEKDNEDISHLHVLG